MVCGPPCVAPPYAGGCRYSKINSLLSLYARAHEACTHAQKSNRKFNGHKKCTQRKETIIQKKENVENLSFQHFQQVFNNKLHKEIRQNDEHSTIQQVFNKVFNRQKDNKKTK